MDKRPRPTFELAISRRIAGYQIIAVLVNTGGLTLACRHLSLSCAQSTIHLTMTAESLPALDLADLDRGAEAASRFRDALRAATHDVGFFYLVGTGVSPDLESRMQRVAKAFFALPEADKLAIENINSRQFRGYTRLGGEHTRGKVDWREQIDIAPEGVALSDEELARLPTFMRLIGPNQWPAALPELREVVLEWREQLTVVATKLLRAWAVCLGEDETYFSKHFGDPFSLLKIVRYPGKEEHEQGVGPHKDAGVLTLLWVEPGKRGLQVERGGQWIDAPPLPGAFVVNIGEMLEMATQGYLKATHHRVLSPIAPDERISIPFFFNPALDARLPLIKLPEGLEGTVSVTDDPANPIHSLYGDNCLKSRLRAHPNVAQAHHADLLVKVK